MRRKGLLVPLTDDAAAGRRDGRDRGSALPHRRRHDLHRPVESPARHAIDIVAETLTVTVSERGATRWTTAPAKPPWKSRKKEGYF